MTNIGEDNRCPYDFCHYVVVLRRISGTKRDKIETGGYLKEKKAS
jgi:hypothetical protein